MAKKKKKLNPYEQYQEYLAAAGQRNLAGTGSSSDSGFNIPPPPGNTPGNPPSNPPSGGNPPGGGAAGPLFTTNAGQDFTQAAFDAYKVQVKQLAGIYGAQKYLTDGIIRAAAEGDVGIAEWQQRLSTYQIMQTNQTVLNDYSAWLAANGKKNDLSTDAGKLKFIAGQSSADFYTTWNQVATESSLQESGITVAGLPAAGKKVADNRDLTLGMSDVSHIESLLGLSPSNTGDLAANSSLQQFASNYAAMALKYLPASRYGSAGLSKTDLEDIAAGTGSAVKVAALNRLAAEEQKFFNDQRANAGLQSTPGGGVAPAATLAGISG